MLYEGLLEKIEEARIQGKKIGLVQGSWDMFHLGHLLYISEARKLCDFLVIGMDSDEKIRKRKGNNRPIIPEKERYDFLSNLDKADYVVIKDVNEPKWGLIKAIKPDVLVAIKENYTDEQIEKLEEYCGRVAILPRQSETSTSDKIRKITISKQINKIDNLDEKISKVINEMKNRIGFTESMMEPIPEMIEQLKFSTDWVCPVASACYYDGRWYYGVNQADFNIPKYDVENRTELYYATTEHAEINMLKKMGNIEKLDAPIWVTLFPCDRCMKVLIDKGVKKIYYLEDHPDRNWSKRSHELAEKNGIEIINVLDNNENINSYETDFSKFRYIYPPNARKQEQLDIMVRQEFNDIDPLDPNVIEQEIIFRTRHWYISKNRFPYEGVEHQFLITSYNPVYRIEDMNSEMWEELARIWIKLKKEYDLFGGAMCFRFGNPALSGASLTRLHAHVIVPYENNKTRFKIGGNKTLKKGLVINNFSKDNK